MANSTLPECTPSSCAPCNIGASTMCISFPYGTIDEVTSTISIIPYVTQYEDGKLSTSFSTVTLDDDPECDFFEEDQFTWVTHGRTLTWPTTYGLLEGFVGRAESTFEPTRTSYGGRDCDGTVGTTAVTLPSTLDPGSFIIPLAASPTTFKAGPLPTDVIEYLDSFATVQEQFNEIPLTSCAPALPVRTACTTILTSTSTTVSCSSVAGDEQSCVTLTETRIETNTHTPHWPTLNGSLTDLKQTAARLTTRTAETTTIQATAEPALVSTTNEPVNQPEQSSDSESPTASSFTTEVSEQSIESTEDSTTTGDSTSEPESTGRSESQGNTATPVRPTSETEPASTSTGSATVDSSAATFTGEGWRAVSPGWCLVLLAGLAGCI